MDSFGVEARPNADCQGPRLLLVEIAVGEHVNLHRLLKQPLAVHTAGTLAHSTLEESTKLEDRDSDSESDKQST